MPDQESPLLDYVRRLEGRSNHERGQQVLEALRSLNIEPRIQASRLLNIRNLIVDFARLPRFLCCAHYDAARGSPGANDNASSVAVLLGLCAELRGTGAPVRVVFFDREEDWLRTPFLGLGVLGSLYYVCANRCRDLRAVFNLEFCGAGDFLGIWSVKPRSAGTEAALRARRAAEELGVPFRTAYIPWLFFSSDHLSFRLRGIKSAVTLSLFPSAQVPMLEELVSGVSLRKLVSGYRPELPEPLCCVHTAQDTSDRLNEESLRLMLSLVREAVMDSPESLQL